MWRECGDIVGGVWRECGESIGDIVRRQWRGCGVGFWKVWKWFGDIVGSVVIGSETVWIEWVEIVEILRRECVDSVEKVLIYCGNILERVCKESG